MIATRRAALDGQQGEVRDQPANGPRLGIAAVADPDLEARSGRSEPVEVGVAAVLDEAATAALAARPIRRLRCVAQEAGGKVERERRLAGARGAGEDDRVRRPAGDHRLDRRRPRPDGRGSGAGPRSTRSAPVVDQAGSAFLRVESPLRRGVRRVARVASAAVRSRDGLRPARRRLLRRRRRRLPWSSGPLRRGRVGRHGRGGRSGRLVRWARLGVSRRRRRSTGRRLALRCGCLGLGGVGGGTGRRRLRSCDVRRFGAVASTSATAPAAVDGGRRRRPPPSAAARPSATGRAGPGASPRALRGPRSTARSSDDRWTGARSGRSWRGPRSPRP